MSNMSYCRFQNTLNDLRDCVSALEELALDLEEGTDNNNELSTDEASAAREMERLCNKYVALMEEIATLRAGQ